MFEGFVLGVLAGLGAWLVYEWVSWRRGAARCLDGERRLPDPSLLPLSVGVLLAFIMAAVVLR